MADVRYGWIPRFFCPSLAVVARSLLASAIPSRPAEFVHKRTGIVDLPERFQNAPRVHVHSPCLFVVVHEVPTKRLDVSVEDDADDLALFIDGRAAGIASNDVCSRD